MLVVFVVIFAVVGVGYIVAGHAAEVAPDLGVNTANGASCAGGLSGWASEGLSSSSEVINIYVYANGAPGNPANTGSGTFVGETNNGGHGYPATNPSWSMAIPAQFQYQTTTYYIYAINQGGTETGSGVGGSIYGADPITLSACATPPPSPSAPPVLGINSASCSGGLSGWASADLSSSTEVVKIDVYANGAPGNPANTGSGTFVGETTNGGHGYPAYNPSWSMAIPAQFQTSNNTFYIYAVNQAGVATGPAGGGVSGSGNVYGPDPVTTTACVTASTGGGSSGSTTSNTGSGSGSSSTKSGSGSSGSGGSLDGTTGGTKAGSSDSGLDSTTGGTTATGASSNTGGKTASGSSGGQATVKSKSLSTTIAQDTICHIPGLSSVLKSLCTRTQVVQETTNFVGKAVIDGYYGLKSRPVKTTGLGGGGQSTGIPTGQQWIASGYKALPNYYYVQGWQNALATGVSAELTQNDPKLAAFNTTSGDHSLMQIAILAPSGQDDVEFGWIVDDYSAGMSDKKPHLFVYAEQNGYNSGNDCYNSCGYVPIPNSLNLQPGDNVNIDSSAQYAIQYVAGVWQIVYNGVELGYIPGSYWSQASNNPVNFTFGADEGAWGEVYTQTPKFCSQMGTGIMGLDKGSAMISNFNLVGAGVAPNFSPVLASNPTAWNLGLPTNTSFTLGGPGQC